MRISTSSIFDRAGARLSDLQAQLNRTGQQIAAGTRVLTPADDPVAAARALEVQQSSSINDQLSKNRLSVKNFLGAMDGSLSSTVDTLQSMKEQVIAAGNGTYSDSDRTAIANVLQGQLEQLVSLANSSDGAGHYLFSGLQTGTAPYALAPTTGSITYQGDALQQSVQVDNSRSMSITQAGQSLFPADQNGKTLFDHMRAAITDLQTPQLTSVTHAAQLALTGGSLDQALTSVSTMQSTVGTQLQQIDSLDSVAGDRKVQYAQTLSDLQALDYNKALSDLSLQQMALQAAQKSFQQISQLSLFNYLS